MIEKGMNQYGNDLAKSLFENTSSRVRQSRSDPVPTLWDPDTVSCELAINCVR